MPAVRRYNEPQLLAAGALGTPGEWKTVLGTGTTGRGISHIVRVWTTGDVELRIIVAETTVGTYTVPGGSRPRDLDVPGGAFLEARRPAPTAGLPTPVYLTILPGRSDG